MERIKRLLIPICVTFREFLPGTQTFPETLRRYPLDPQTADEQGTGLRTNLWFEIIRLSEMV
jgi:hypothetical protein